MMTDSTKSTSKILEKVVTPTSLLIIDGDVVKTYTNPDVEFSEESAGENVDAIWGLIKDKRIYHLFVPDSSTSITIEARSYKHEEFENLKKAQAIVSKTLGHSILAQFYKNANKKCGYPIRIFDSEFKAMQWFGLLREAQ